MENVGESFAAGIDKLTGENRWRIERPRGINWVSPVVIQNGGQAEIVFQGPDGLDGPRSATGKKKWNAPKLRFSTYASLTYGDGVVYVAARSSPPCARPARRRRAGSRLGTDQAASQLLFADRPQGRVYVVNGSGIVNCADAKTGAIVWTHRLEGAFAASPLLADGKLYFVNEKGVTTVMEAGEEAKVLATNVIDDTILATPVASDGAIFLRSDGALYCIDGKEYAPPRGSVALRSNTRHRSGTLRAYCFAKRPSVYPPSKPIGALRILTSSEEEASLLAKSWKPAKSRRPSW